MRKIFYILFILLINTITPKIKTLQKSSKKAEFRSLLKLLKKGHASAKTVQKVTNIYFLEKNKKKSRKLIMGILDEVLPSLKAYLPALLPMALGGAFFKVRSDQEKHLKELKKKWFAKNKALNMVKGEISSRKAQVKHELTEVGINLDGLDKMLTETVPQLSVGLSERIHLI